MPSQAPRFRTKGDHVGPENSRNGVAIMVLGKASRQVGRRGDRNSLDANRRLISAVTRETVIEPQLSANISEYQRISANISQRFAVISQRKPPKNGGFSRA